MRLGILFSSGKDSTNALWYYLEQGWDVVCLLSLLPENPDSWMFQNPSRELLEAQARSLELPILFEGTAGEKETELLDLRRLLVRAKDEFALDGIAAGAVASDYQHERITRLCHGIGLKTYSPLWHKDQGMLLREMVEAGFDIRMTRIAADGLSKEWLGRNVSLADIGKLEELHRKTGFHIGGEGGEFETIVLDGPIFSSPLEIAFDTEMESEHRGELLISRVS